MNEEKDIKEYEIAFLGKTEGAKEEVMKAIVKHGGEVFHEGPVEHIPLSYKIKKETSGYFGYLHIRFSPDKVKALREQLGASTEVIRFLVITPPFEKPQRWVPRAQKAQTPEEAAAAPAERKKLDTLPLSNEALEKRIEEIMQ